MKIFLSVLDSLSNISKSKLCGISVRIIFIFFSSNAFSTVIYLINKTGAKDCYIKIISPENLWEPIDFKHGIELPKEAHFFIIEVKVKNKIRDQSERIKIYPNNIYNIKYENSKFKIEKCSQPELFHIL